MTAWNLLLLLDELDRRVRFVGPQALCVAGGNNTQAKQNDENPEKIRLAIH